MTTTVDTVDLDDLHEPERTEKLHPWENDEGEEWESFKESVGQEPNKPLDVRENGSGYDVIDGDRRLRALKENDAEEVECRIFTEMSDEEFYLRRVRANEARKENDPFKRSWYTAQFVAPWLLPPGERFDVEKMSQYDYADAVGVTQGSVSNWLGPIKDIHPLRAVLDGKVGNHVTQGHIEKIDECVACLTGRRGSRVIPDGQIGWAADQMADMEHASLAELHTTAEKASDEKWSLNKFLEYIDEHFGHDTPTVSGSGIQSGVVGTYDDSPVETRDGNPDKVAPPDPEPTPEPDPDFVQTDIDVTWREYVSDDDLPGDTTVSSVAMRRMGPPISIEDEPRAAIEMLSEVLGIDRDEVVNTVLGGAIVDEAVNILQDRL